MYKAKTMNLRLICIALFLGSFHSGFAQSELSLQDMINTALEQNYQIQIFANNKLAAQNSNTVGNAGMLPDVDLTGEYRLSLNNTEQKYFTGDGQSADNAKSTALTGNVGVNWVVFDGLAMFARKSQLEHLEKLSDQDLRFYIEQTAYDIAYNYYRLAQEQKLLRLYRTSIEVSQSRLDFETQSFDVGLATALDVQQALVDRNTDSSMVLEQRALIREIEIELNRVINRDLVAPIQLADSIQLKGGFDLVNLMETSRSNNAELNRQQLTELASISNYKVAQGDLYPVVELFGNYGYNKQANEVGFLETSRQFGPNAGVRIRFNLFQGGQYNIRAKNLKLESESEGLRTDDLKQEVEGSVRVAYLRWSSRLEQVQLEMQSVEAAQKALDIAWKQFEIGTLTNVDFRVIQLNAVNAQSRLLTAQFAAKTRELELNRLSGTLMESVF